MSQDEEIRDAQRRLALGSPMERRADRLVGLASLASVFDQVEKTRLDRMEEAAREKSRSLSESLREIDDLDHDRSRHFDRRGRPIPFSVYISMEDAYRYVARTDVGDLWVSTVWLGINHRHGSGPPLIFETMVFERESDMAEKDAARYSTEEEAVRGHFEMVEKCRRGEITARPIEERHESRRRSEEFRERLRSGQVLRDIQEMDE